VGPQNSGLCTVALGFENQESDEDEDEDDHEEWTLDTMHYYLFVE
jgi:hypothetical protein